MFKINPHDYLQDRSCPWLHWEVLQRFLGMLTGLLDHRPLRRFRCKGPTILLVVLNCVLSQFLRSFFEFLNNLGHHETVFAYVVPSLLRILHRQDVRLPGVEPLEALVDDAAAGYGDGTVRVVKLFSV